VAYVQALTWGKTMNSTRKQSRLQELPKRAKLKASATGRDLSSKEIWRAREDH
jgi:hypothetical protein